MWSFSVIFLLGAALSVASVAATVSDLEVLPSSSSPQCIPTTVTTTVYYPLVATVPSNSITIIQDNPAAIAAQASSDAAINTEYEIDQSQVRPESDQPSTGYPVHTDVLTALAAQASKGPGDVYWSESGFFIATVGTTTVTVMPQSAPTAGAAAHEEDGTVTYTVSPFPASSTGNTTQATSGASSGRPPYGYANITSAGPNSTVLASDSAVLTVSSVDYVTTTTMSVEFNATFPPGYGTLSPYQPSTTGDLNQRDPHATCTWVCAGRLGCWCNNWGGNGKTLTDTDYDTTTTPLPWTQLHPTTITSRIAPRQTCTLVSAPGYGSWCNNYEGSTTVDYTVWDTTTTPGVPTSSVPETTTEVTAISTVSLESASATASPTACGQTGPFEVSFDQLPAASIPSNDTQDHPPIDEFIDHFVWGLDWTYGPPPSEPYAPHDQPYLGWYIPNLNDNNTNSPSHNTGSVPPGGSFGAGSRKDNSSFWFNANSAYAACDNQNQDPNFTCDFVATAFQYANGDDQVVATQHFTLPPCPNNVNCQLHMIKFNNLFTKLSALSFYANVQGQIKALYMDALELEWYDNNCTAGLEREESP